jgi:hypothetical protein
VKTPGEASGSKCFREGSIAAINLPVSGHQKMFGFHFHIDLDEMRIYKQKSSITFSALTEDKQRYGRFSHLYRFLS